MSNKRVIIGVSGNAVSIDDTSNSLTTITTPHAEIHNGNHFYMEGYTTLDSGEHLYVKLETPDTTKWAHFKWEIFSTGVLLTTFDEGATGGMTGGSSVTPLNNDRNSSTTSGLTLTSGVAIATSYDTRISNQRFGVTSNPAKATGGGSERDTEIILKQNTVYLRTFTSASAANIINFRASWYEKKS